MNDPVTPIRMSEVANILRRVLRGETLVRGGEPYVPNESNAVNFVADDFHISIYDDAGSLDYVIWAESPDGRRCGFDDWYDAAMRADLEITNPLDMLAEKEQEALQKMLVMALLPKEP